MTCGNIPVVSKRAWSNLIWERTWKLDDADWRATSITTNDNDLLALTIGNTRYITWWYMYLSDQDYRLTKKCETMSKIVCHASVLKTDDFRLKGLPMSNRTCIMCDMFCVEDILLIITKCPYYQKERDHMYEEIFKNCPNAMESALRGFTTFHKSNR